MQLNDPPKMVHRSTERGGRIILKPLNAKYSQIEIEKGDADLYILGKVIARVPKIEKVDGIF